MKNRYIIGIFLAIAIITLNQIFIQYWLYQKNQDAKLINIAGRQRMLSQKIALQFYQFKDGDNSSQSVKNTVTEWEKVHNTLIYGNKNLNIKPVKDELARKLLKETSSKITFIKEIVESKSPITNVTLKQVLSNQETFLNAMDKTVASLVKESDKKLKFIVFIEILLASISIIIIVLEVKYIYSPIEKNLNKVIEKLSYSENVLSILYESIHEACVYIDNDLKIKYYNNIAKKFYSNLFGKYPLIADNCEDFVPLNLKSEFNNYYMMALKGNKSTFEKNINDKWWSFLIYPVYNKNQEIAGIAQNIRDISDIKENENKRKTMEKRLQIITSNFPYGSISLIDKNLNFLYTGGLGYKDYNINPIELIGKPISSILSDEIFRPMQDHLPKCFNGEVQSYKVNFKNKIFLNTLQPIENQEGIIDSFVILVMDVTERVNNEEKIKKQNYKLKAIAWQQSHELRRPIANLIGIVELLKEDDYFSNNEYLPLINKTIIDIDSVIEKITGYT